MKQLFSTEADPNLGIEDMLDDFLTFFIAGKIRLTLIYGRCLLNTKVFAPGKDHAEKVDLC